METKIAKFQEAFKTMSYGVSTNDTKKAMDWLKNVNIVDKSGEINTIVESVKIDAYRPQKNHFIRLAEEIEKNSELISQIEILSRGILAKDTKKALSILAQYFTYYANFVWKNQHENPEWKPEGFAVAVFGEDHPLWTLGLVLAPALAAGYSVLIQTGVKMAGAVTFLLELATKVGIPQDALVLVPSNEGGLEPYLSNEKVSVVSIFVDIFDTKYRGINKLHKKVLILSSYKSPMIVFDNADLHSAVESVSEAAWGYQGMVLISREYKMIKNIQETIFNTFCDELKRRVKNVTIGSGDDKNADISYPSNPNIYTKMCKIVEKAKNMGIEVYQQNESASNFTPTLILGSKVDTNNVLKRWENDGIVTVVAFRSIDEAVGIANNTRQGLGASVWTENIGLANEVTRKLKVSNVWINSHGLINVEHPLCPLKESGFGYFGGKQGFAEYVRISKPTSQTSSIELPEQFNQVEAVANYISAGKNASASWNKITFSERMKVLQQIAEFLSNKKGFPFTGLSEKWLQNLVSAIDEYFYESKNVGVSFIPGHSVTSFKEPRGVVAIEMRSIDKHNVRLLWAAILEGNAVLLLNEAPETKELYQEISKRLPSNVLKVVPYSLEAVKTASLHNELNGYYASDSTVIYGSLPLADSKIFALVTDDWEDIGNRVCICKNVWNNVGQSSQCSL